MKENLATIFKSPIMAYEKNQWNNHKKYFSDIDPPAVEWVTCLPGTPLTWV